MAEPTYAAAVPQLPADLSRGSNLLTRACRTATAVAMRAYLRGYHRFEIAGLEHLPTGGGSYVLVANHASHLDALCLLSALPLGYIHRAYPIAARDYFFSSAASTALAATLINALPFDRTGNVRHGMSLCRDLLREDGNVLIVFPEGTRSTVGAVGPFRRGVGDLVAGTHVPVVPCYLQGTREAMPKGSVVPRPRAVRLVVGRPRTYAHLEPGKSTARMIGEDLRRAVLALAPHAGSNRTARDATRSLGGRRIPLTVVTPHARPHGKAA